MSARLAAWRVLRSGRKLSLRSVDRAAERAELDARDRALLRKLVGTVERRRAALRALTEHLGDRRLHRDAAVFAWIGLVQLLFLDHVPDHAAVGETVEAAAHALGPRKAAAVNAILRRTQQDRRRGASGDPRQDLPLTGFHLAAPVFHDPREHWLLWAEEAWSLPVALGKRWRKRWGDERALQLAAIALREPEVSVRVARGDVELARTELAAAIAPHELRPGLHARILLAPTAAAGAIVRSEAFSRGDVTIQGESAFRAAELVAARAGERVLDLCAAPGGKTAVLAATGASVVAVDSSTARAERLRATLARLAPAAQVDVRLLDGTSALEPGSFDAALVDVPCSNTGVLAARPSARWRFGPESQRSLSAIQARLLREAAACVRAGGRLVYSTCSVEPEENQRRVRAFLAEAPEWTLEAEIESLPAEPGGNGPVDGGYAARLTRRRAP